MSVTVVFSLARHHVYADGRERRPGEAWTWKGSEAGLRAAILHEKVKVMVENQPIPCRQCSMAFVSERALFGHVQHNHVGIEDEGGAETRDAGTW